MQLKRYTKPVNPTTTRVFYLKRNMANLWQIIVVAFMHFYTWLKRCLEQIQRCLCFKSSLNWVQFGQADSGVVEEKSDNLQSYVWRTNQDYRTYRHQSNGPMVMVQTSTHTFHVSIYISKHKPQTVTILAHNHMMSLLALPGRFGEACRLQRVFHGSVPLLHERDI